LCNRCKTRASLPLDAIRRLRDTPIWKIDAALKCRSCWKVRYAPPVHMIKLTETRENHALRVRAPVLTPAILPYPIHISAIYCNNCFPKESVTWRKVL
jgi:hypothetical protein